MQSRYYDPETGRFLNADDVRYIGYSGEQLSYNIFAYCENNAVNDSDPWGTISLNQVFGYSSVVSSVLSALGTIFLLAFRQSLWGKMFSVFIASTAIISTFYSYLSAVNSAKKFYGKNNKNYKNLLKYNSALLIATVASVIIGEVLSVRYLIKFSSNIAYELIRIRTFTIIGLTFSAAELLTNKSLYYRSRVKK